MQVIETVAGMVAQREHWRQTGQRVGLVPTMGFLHEGHLSLVRQALADNDLVVISIFVNPLQFGPQEDFGRYPRNLERDLALLETAGVSAVYHPALEEIYPPGFNTAVEVGDLSESLEGAVRPGHFRGVTTVVAKLFNTVGPRRAYFGQKDAQQVAIIKKMVRDLNFPLDIVVCPTLREPDGLALSSRNVYLSPEDRRTAPVLYRALQAAAQLWQSGTRDSLALRSVMSELIATEPAGRPDYISAANPLTLLEYEGYIEAGQGVLLSLAIRFGTTRLLDNILLEAN